MPCLGQLHFTLNLALFYQFYVSQKTDVRLYQLMVTSVGLAWNDVSMNNIWNDVSMNNMTSFSWNFSENDLVGQIFSFFRVHIRVYKIRFISFDISCTYPSLVCKKTNLMLHHGHQFLFFIAYTTGTKRFINFVLTEQKFRFLEDTQCSWNLAIRILWLCVRKIQNVLNWKNRQFSIQIA